MEYFYRLKEMLCDELKDIVKKGELSAGNLDTIDKLTHSIKSILAIIEKEESGNSYEGGYSGRRRRNSMGRYADNDSSYGNYNDNSEEGYSGRRYSRDEGKTKLIQGFQELMQDANSQEEKELLRNTLNKLKNM